MMPSPHRFTKVLSVAVCLLGISVPASAQNGRTKLDTVLRAMRPEGTVQRVIIQTRAGRSTALKNSLQAHGDVVKAEHPALNALTVLVHGEDFGALAADPSVLAVSIDAEVTSFGYGSTSSKGSHRHTRQRLNRTRSRYEDAPSFPKRDLLRESVGVAGLSHNGAGVNIAVVDSGIDPNRDLADNIAGFWDFTRGGVAAAPGDQYGHGTHIAGLIASSGLDSNKEFAGVAPGVRLYGFKVLDENGRGRASDVVKALEFIVASKRSQAAGAPKIDIINLSLGHPVYEPAETDPLVLAVEYAVRAGIVVVTAAGNIGVGRDGDPGYTGITSPGNAPSAITVGAVDTKGTVRLSDDRIAAFSSRGPTWYNGFAKPDLVAPGVNLTSDTPKLSELMTAYPELGVLPKRGKGDFGTMSGTSMAAAVATGVSSVVLQASRVANSGSPLTPNALKAVLQYTALPLKDAAGESYDALTQGTGSINTRGAVAMAQAINTQMPVGTAWLRSQVEPVTSVAGVVVPWSKALLWDDNIVWGTDALAFNGPQWADNIVWGTAFADDNIVWGTAADFDNIVWGTVADWSTDLVWGDRLVGLMQDDDNIVWGTAAGLAEDNIVWGSYDGDNIVWGTWDEDNIVWGTADVDNIVWGTADVDNIVWGTADVDNIVWGTADVDNIVWGTALEGVDNIVWGTGIAPGIGGGR
jgi:serine protease AprX